MKEARAKKQLRHLLRSFIAGTIPHLRSDVFRAMAVQAQVTSDRRVHLTLIISCAMSTRRIKTV